MKNETASHFRSRLCLGVWIFLMTACTASPRDKDGAESKQRDPYVGQWGMATKMGSNEMPAVLTLSYSDTGELVGIWASRGETMELFDLVVDGDSIQFSRVIPGGQKLHFEGVVSGEQLNGAWKGSFGELPSNGTRGSINPFPDRHSNPIVEKDGYSLLWANEDEAGEASWFDVTDARIDPATFQFGIGKDTIPSIDEPVFVKASDPLLAERGVLPETEVLGVILEGEARAYPVDIMSMHEVVNDDFGGSAFAVLW